jgi:uncharacterized protein YukE
MGDELKVVNPPEIMAYGKRLNTNIDTITTEANGLIADVTNVDYHGTNAFKLKTDANHMSEQFAKDMFQRVSTLSSNVSKATSSISGSLGGHAVTIDLGNNSVTMLDVPPDTGVQIADPSALTSLVSAVQGRFERIRTAINATKQMPENSRTGWMGAARNTCEQTVGQFASNAVTATNNAEQQLVNYLTKQRDAVVESDVA